MAVSIEPFRFLKKVLEMVYGYPHFKQAYIERYIKIPGTDPEELDEYIGHGHNHYVKLTLIFFMWFNFARNIAYPSVVFYEMDLVNIERNLKEVVGHGPNVVSFSCLATNCSRVVDADEIPSLHSTSWIEAEPIPQASDAERLADELRRLPFFRICYPFLGKSSDPNSLLDYLGMFICSCSGLTIFVAGILIPFLQRLLSSGDLFCMAIAAPKVTRQIVRNRARQFKVDLDGSLINYRAMLVQKQFKLICESRQEIGWLSRLTAYSDDEHLSLNSMGSVSSLFKQHSQGHQFVLLAKQRPRSHHPTDQQRLDRFAEDCVPLARSDWWREMVCGAFYRFYRIHFINWWCIFFSIWMIVLWQASNRRQFLNKVVQYTKLNNCSIWNLDSPATRTGIDLEAYAQPIWNPLFVLNYVAQFTPMISLFLIISVYCANNTDLFFWFREIEFQLRLGLEFVRQLLAEARAGASDDTPEGGCSQFDMSIIRDKFKPLISVTHLVVLIGPFESEAEPWREARQCSWQRLPGRLIGMVFHPRHTQLQMKLEIEHFIAKTIRSRRLNRRSLVDLLEKSQVSYRIFVEHIRGYATQIAVFILCSVFVNYCFCVTVICYIKLIRGFTLWPSLVLVACVLFTNLIILVASNFHAKLRKMQLLIWSLIAETSNSGDLQVEHLRALWLRHAENSSADGGIAFSASGIRITYVNIIQLFIGVGTFVVVVLRM